MSNNLRTRNGMPFNFVNGLKVRGMDIESLIPGIEGIPEAGSKYQFAGNGTNKIFTLPVSPYNKDAIDVHVKQLYVHPNDYTLVGDTLTLTEAPPAVVAGETYNVVIKVSLTTLNGYVNASRVSFEGENLDDILEKSKPIANYPALRAYAGAATQVRITDPGVAGFFYYDAADTTSVDNGGTVIVANNGKRWKRVFDGAVNVKWFGAGGDGVADDTAAMNAAATAAGAAKKALFVPAGVYKMTAPWVIPIKVYVLGESPSVQSAYDPGAAWAYGAIIFKAHTGNAITKIGSIAYEEGAPIENITISSHRTTYPGGNGFVLDKCSNVHLIRCNAFGIGGDCFVLGVSAGDVTGHNYVFNCYSNNPTGVHYRVRQKWGRFHYPVTDGGTHGMYLNAAPETHVDGFHFEGFQTAAIRITNGSTSSRFVGKGFIGNTANALNGVIIDDFVGNNSIVFENIKVVGSNVANSVGLSIGAAAVDTRVQGCEFSSWPTAINNNANYGYSQSWVLDCQFYANELCIRSNAQNTQYRGNSFDSTTGSYDINHVFGSAGLWSGNVFSKGINPAATGVQGNFSGIRVKENIGYVSRNRGTTGSITAYTNIAHGLAGTPSNLYLSTYTSGITSTPQINSRDDTNFNLYWTGTANAQWAWEAALPCDY